MNVNGQFQLWVTTQGVNELSLTVGVSGNAKQRRLYVRRWKKLGYIVTQWDSNTRKYL